MCCNFINMLKSQYHSLFRKNWRLITIQAFNRNKINLTYVPPHDPVKDEEICLLQDFIDMRKKLLVLTGAGVSTESGIPDYRSAGVGMYARTSSRPIQYADFIREEQVRKRYWARNAVGWHYFSNVQPNCTHLTLKHWEENSSKLLNIVTQNVDGLHLKAGSQKVMELHGNAFKVKCLNCHYTVSRHEFQKTLLTLNSLTYEKPISIRPDGDVDLPLERHFVVPPCPHCKGILMPDIVFFGDIVPKAKVNQVYDEIQNADGLLVLGSSLQVYSAFRFILAAAEQKKAIVIINIGKTRGDNLATIKINARCGDLLPRIVA